MKILNVFPNIQCSSTNSARPAFGISSSFQGLARIPEKDTLSINFAAKIEQSKLNSKQLVETHPLHVLLCNRLGVNVSDFDSVEDLEQFVPKRWDSIELKEDLVQAKIELEKAFWNSKLSMDLSRQEFYKFKSFFPSNDVKSKYKFFEKINESENNVIKKLLLYSDMQKYNGCVVPYNKEIAKETFDELSTKIKKDSDFDVYKLYADKYVNSDKIGVKMPSSCKEKFGDKIIVSADSDEAMASFTLISGNQNKAYLHSLEVYEPYRHSRMSKKALNLIFEDAERTCRQNGLSSIELDVLNYNTRAVQGYINKQNFQCPDFDLMKFAQRLEKMLEPNLISSKNKEKIKLGTELFSEYSQMDSISHTFIDSVVYRYKKLNEVPKYIQDFVMRYMSYRALLDK